MQLHVALISKSDQVHPSHVDLGLSAVVECGYPHSDISPHSDVSPHGDVSPHSDIRLNLSLQLKGIIVNPTP